MVLRRTSADRTRPSSIFNAPAKPPWTWARHIIRRERLGVTQSARDTFTLLAQAHWLTPAVAEQMKRMVGFRNVAVHDDQSLQLPITLNILTLHLDDFLLFSRQMLLHDDGGF
jgi:uncharacterized protein YutE (UPF0331/DUF86 family)